MSSTPSASAATTAGKHFLSITDLSPQAIVALLDLALHLKAHPAAYTTCLPAKTAVMLFEKPSLRTRCSFEIGMAKLGGQAVYLDHNSTKIGERETVEDYAQNLSQWCELIIARTNCHSTVERLAKAATVPVINALTDLEHPCQILADFLTLKEVFGSLDNFKMVYIGDGNNVCHSTLLGAAMLGMEVSVVTPPGHEPSPEVVEEAVKQACITGATIHVGHDLSEVEGANAVYTDTWISMGDDADPEAVIKNLMPYQVNERLMAKAHPDAVFMHCLPAHRGHEVTAQVIDGPKSVVLQQAQNRMHAQNALMLSLLGAASHTSTHIVINRPTTAATKFNTNHTAANIS
ncbi:MAG: ornithine carbamoyltransferase [Phycisphaerales bacterium]|jgi:ornithine carbamoyltransferase